MQPTNPSPKAGKTGFQGIIDICVILVLKLLQICGLLLLIALGSFGIVTVGSGCIEVIGSVRTPQAAQQLQHIKSWREHIPELLKTTFVGLELLLLAPLAFLMLRSLAQYVEDLQIRAEDVTNAKKKLRQGGSVQASRTTHLENSMTQHGKESLLETKAIMIGLLFGVVATHMVGEIIAKSQEHPFDPARGLIALGMMVLLATVYIAIEALVHKMQKDVAKHISRNAAEPQQPQPEVAPKCGPEAEL